MFKYLHSFIFLIFIFLIYPLFAEPWNGNGSIISHSTGSRTGFGLTKDVTKAEGAKKSSVVFFQWEVDNGDGNNLEIDIQGSFSSVATEATITYGRWDSSKEEKITYENVSFPFILDPTRDNLRTRDGDWFTIAVSFTPVGLFDASITPPVFFNVEAKATDSNGTNRNRSTTKEIRFSDSDSFWGGNGSLISKGSGNRKGFGMTKDIAAVKHGIKSSVFFQWEVDSSDGKSIYISSDRNCFNRAKITKGDWNTRAHDSTEIVTLPHKIHTNKGDGDWVLIRVDLLDDASCDDFVRAEIAG